MENVLINPNMHTISVNHKNVYIHSTKGLKFFKPVGYIHS